MYNGAFASTGWHGWGFDLSITSSQSYWSSKRALCQTFLLWNTMHRGFFTVIIFIAPFNISVYLRVKWISLFIQSEFFQSSIVSENVNERTWRFSTVPGHSWPRSLPLASRDLFSWPIRSPRILKTHDNELYFFASCPSNRPVLRSGVSFDRSRYYEYQANGFILLESVRRWNDRFLARTQVVRVGVFRQCDTGSRRRW